MLIVASSEAEAARIAADLEDALNGLHQAITERDRQEIELRLKSPKRPGHIDAKDAAHLPLFVAANEPGLGL